MKRIINGLAVVALAVTMQGCDLFGSLDVRNENSPDLAQVFADPQEYPALISGAYRTWWNQSVGTNPNLALGVAAEVITSGYGSWGMADYYRVPRQPITNADADDIVLNPLYGAWYSYYSALPTVNNIINQVENNGRKVPVGNQDYTEGALAHAYLLQGMLIGHLALIYDKAFLITEDTDINEYDYQFTPADELMDFALQRIDRAISICEATTFTDPIEMMPTVQFDNVSLCQFANTYAARLLVASARTDAHTNAIDWGRVLNYARKGLQSNFSVRNEPGWNGLAITRDALSVVNILSWDWIRPHQRMIHKMAPNDPGAVYPWPEATDQLPEVTQPIDHRLETDFVYAGRHGAWNPTTRGYHILSNYRYAREEFAPYMQSGLGQIYFIFAAENDLLEAEALVRSGGSRTEAADLINNTRVDRGGMSALTGSESQQEMIDAIMHERYIELFMTYPALGFFDRRRTDGLMPGTADQFPVPAKELLLHGHEIYTFGG
jgi:starch-binding outer membrane protein, SusD/RagB family